jgi:curved DNA-binding protein CbpA
VKNYYEILEISPSAKLAEIKVAYKKLAFKYHPDKNPGNHIAEEKFKEVNSAYQVLSNEEKRLQYDFILLQHQFNRYNKATPTPPPYFRSGNKGTKRPFNYKSTPQPTPRENNIATFYAFSLVIIVALSVLVFHRAIKYYRQGNEEKNYARYVTLYKEAHQNYMKGYYSIALNQLERIQDKNFSEPNSDLLFKQILAEVKNAANYYYQARDYKKAIDFYTIIFKYNGIWNSDMYFRLASAYTQEGKYTQAIAVYQMIAEEGLFDVEAYTELALIYRDYHKNIDKALELFLKARATTFQQYELTYGKAYHILVNPEITPDGHFHLYNELGKTYLEIENYQLASECFTWAIFLKPVNMETYKLRGICFYKLNIPQKACSDWIKYGNIEDSEIAEFQKTICL